MFTVNQAVVHALIKEQHKPIQPSVIQTELLDPEDEKVVKLVTGVVNIYGSRNNNAHYGVFRKYGDGRGQFPVNVDGYIASSTITSSDFLDLTKVAMDELYSKAENNSASSGGYMLFADYQNEAGRFLLAAMIKQKEGLTLNKKLKLELFMQLDLTRLHQAARINFSKYKDYLDANSEERAELVYLSFISPKVGIKASGYFVTALGCIAGATAATATSNLIKASGQFFRDHSKLGSSDRYQFRQDLLGYIKSKSTLGQFVKLTEVESIARKYIPSSEPLLQDEICNELISHLNNEENQVPSEFLASEKTLNRFTQINYKSDNWQFKFQINSLGNDETAEIFYDKETNKLIIREVPLELRSQIEEELDIQASNKES